MKDVHKGQYQVHMKMLLEGATEFGVQVDKGEFEALDMDSPVGVGRIEGLDKFVDKDNYLPALKWQQVRDIFEGAGFIKSIEALAFAFSNFK